MATANFYELLGVSRDASDADIRAKFRLLARDRHPDRFQGERKAEAEKEFQLLTEAVNVLTNPQRRKTHDFDLDKRGREASSDPHAVAKAYLTMGVRAFKAGDVRAAVEHFDMAVKHNPNDAKAYHYLAMAYSRDRRWLRQAVAALERAMELEPMNPTYIKDAAALYRQAGLASKAERAYEQVLKWMPDDEESQEALADLRGRKADPQKGILGGLFRKSDA